MGSEKLTEGQRTALRWADGKHARHWQGVRFGSPPVATVKAMLRRGLIARVGHVNMNLFTLTDLGRSALSTTTKGVGDE